MLIDALERFIDGAQYYYTAAQTFWRQTIKGAAMDAARALIQRAVREHLRPIERTLRDIRDRLDDRWDELIAQEGTLIEGVQEDADFQVEALQERIDGIQEQIDALRDEQRALERQQASYRETEDDVVDFLHAVRGTVAQTSQPPNSS